jgi:hypothetical protein
MAEPRDKTVRRIYRISTQRDGDRLPPGFMMRSARRTSGAELYALSMID